MGMSLDFLCPACGLEGQVSRGPDCGMMVGTTTIYCLTCQTLQDAVVEKQRYTLVPRVNEPRCEKRKSHPIKLWNKDEPCPRCGLAHLHEDPNGEVLMWD